MLLDIDKENHIFMKHPFIAYTTELASSPKVNTNEPSLGELTEGNIILQHGCYIRPL